MATSMLSVDDARTTILAAIDALGSERVMLDAAWGRILAEDIVSPIDWPRFDNSAMDGYAVHHADLAPLLGAEPTPVGLDVIETIAAGANPTRTPPRGTCVRIMTGAPMPDGVDTVVVREDTDESGAPDRVTIRVAPSKGQGANIRRRGENIRQGDVAIARGRRIDAGAIGLLASFGRARVSVARRPRVAIVSTGDELVELDEAVGDGQIINSSSYMLAAQVREAGGEPVVLPIVRDERDAVEAAFDHALRVADVVVSIGGVSVGDRDLVREVIEARSGGGVSFWRVAMKPGKPLAFGRVDGVPLFGLPGNPVSSFVTFALFVRPALQRMLGHHRELAPRTTALATGPMRGPRGRTEFVRGRVRTDAAGQLHFESVGARSSANLLSVSCVDALAVVEPGAQIAAGEPVAVELLAVPTDGRSG